MANKSEISVESALEGIERTRMQLDQTQKSIQSAQEKSARILSDSESIEKKWLEFQKAFEEMNKKMIENIALSLGGSPAIQTSPVKHRVIPASDCIPLIKKAKSIVVMTGAGISVDSGIPTYRGKDGYWKKGSKNYRAQEVATRHFFEENPEEQWEYMFERYENMSNARPNPGHYAMVELENYCRKNKKSFTLISQNIDALHKKAGTENICEIHGNMSFARCSNRDCEQYDELIDFPKPSEKSMDSNVPKCKMCQANLRPHVLFFDESYSEKLYKSNSALTAVEGAEVFLVIGTTFQTNLPLRLLSIANKNNATIIDINPNLNNDVAVCSLKQVKETSTEFLTKTVEALLRKKAKKKGAKYKKK